MASDERPQILVVIPPVLQERLFSDIDWRRLASLGSLTTTQGSVGPPEQDLAGFTIFVTGWESPPLTDEVLARAPKLGLVAHAGGSIKSIIAPAVWEHGVQVTSAAAANALPVAEYTVAAILFANKGIFQFREQYRAERRLLFADLLSSEAEIGNYRKRVGIIGASRVGRRVIELLRQFDLLITVFDPYLTPDEAVALGVAKAELDEVMSTCDVVSVHAPALPETHRMVGAAELSMMRDGSTLINSARGTIVDPLALEKELASGRIHAVLDTTDPEPLPSDSSLYDLPNVFLTPHVAGSWGNELYRLGELIVDEIARYVRGESLRYEVLAEDLSRIA